MEKTIGEQFRSYLLKQEDPSYTIREASDEEGRHIFFETQEASASVTMHTINGTEICELRIVSTKTGRTPFYLHFELNDLSHAIDLFHEMTASLKKQSETRVIHVLLCCTSGITTSYFTARMKDAARMMELPYAFEAVSYDHLFQKGTGADVILLAKNVDGVYNADPAQVADAVKYDTITYDEVLAQHLMVMDTTATSLSMDNNIPVLVFALKDPQNIVRALCGENVGTVVSNKK